jgi:hypothetical protein
MRTMMELKLRSRLIGVLNVRFRITYGHHIREMNCHKSHQAAWHSSSLSLKLLILLYLKTPTLPPCCFVALKQGLPNYGVFLKPKIPYRTVIWKDCVTD